MHPSMADPDDAFKRTLEQEVWLLRLERLEFQLRSEGWPKWKTMATQLLSVAYQTHCLEPRGSGVEHWLSMMLRSLPAPEKDQRRPKKRNSL